LRLPPASPRCSHCVCQIDSHKSSFLILFFCFKEKLSGADQNFLLVTHSLGKCKFDKAETDAPPESPSGSPSSVPYNNRYCGSYSTSMKEFHWQGRGVGDKT